MTGYAQTLVQHVGHTIAQADCVWCPEPDQVIQAAMQTLHDHGVGADEYQRFLSATWDTERRRDGEGPY